MDDHHYDGPLPENILAESITQYSILSMPTYTLRIQKLKRRSTKKDNCVIMSSNVICIVENIIERNGEIFLVCSTFEKVDPFYDTPCSSTSVGIFECSRISSTVQLFHINSVKFKASYFSFSDKELEWWQNTFYVCSLLHIYN